MKMQVKYHHNIPKGNMSQENCDGFSDCAKK